MKRLRLPLLAGGLCIAWGSLILCRPVCGQADLFSPATAAAATELPLGPWGPYSRTHRGPCYLADRVRAQCFAFPIVVGQRREEVILTSVKAADGKVRPGFERAVLERRSMGLAPVQAGGDDRLGSDGAVNNRHAQMMEANANGLLWRAKIAFAPAAFTQKTATVLDAEGRPLPSPGWGAGEALVDYFPAFVDTEAGLLVRVTLTNRSDAPQTYFVDLLGGMNGVAADFQPSDLSIQVGDETGNERAGNKRAGIEKAGNEKGADEKGDERHADVLVRHAKSEFLFALAADAAGFSTRLYHVSDAYFSLAGAVAQRDETGGVLPAGLLRPAPGAESRDGKAVQKPARPTAPGSEDPKNAQPEQHGHWGLTRVDDIAVPPGQSVTLFLCVGLGKEADAAHAAVQTLLARARETDPAGKPRVGAFDKAWNAHLAMRFTSRDEAIDRLMAQSLVNVPFFAWRRVGVPSRQPLSNAPPGIYQPALGGLIALGWAFYRPDWSAAQLNAFYLITGAPEAPIVKPQAIAPTNLFALWELYQRTHETALLERFYPFARRRYRELLAAGRRKEDAWLFAWPDGETQQERMPAEAKKADVGRADVDKADAKRIKDTPHAFAPDYSAYVIRAAKIMRRIAETLHRPGEEERGYAQDAAQATRALNTTLWSAKDGLYTERWDRETEQAVSENRLVGLLPMIAGADVQTPEQRAALLKTLSDPATFWSGAGLRSASKAAAGYRANSLQSGAVRIGENWLLWKALLDLGEAETARKLAENVLRAYHAASSDVYPQGLDGDTGAAVGAVDYSGDACAAIPLHAAYHLPGTVSSGWDIDVLGSRYDGKTDKLNVVFKSLDAAGKGTLLCVLGKPNGSYLLSGALSGTVTADANGVLMLTAPRDSTTQSLDIAPAAGGSP